MSDRSSSDRGSGGTPEGGVGTSGGSAAHRAGGSGAPAEGGTGGTGSLFEDCDDATLATACAARECGSAPGCTTPCGTCDAGERCLDGRCSLPTCTGSDCECGDIDFTMQTSGSCSLGLAAGTVLDGEAFITIDGTSHRVLAMNRWGAGHFAAWCDASTIGTLMRSFNAGGYLGQVAQPRIASFGNTSTCKPGILSTPIPDDVEYLGSELPVEYLGDPARLAGDYDALVFCGYHTEWDPGWAALLQAYVTEYGRGLLAVMDYQGFDIPMSDFDRMNEVVAPTGVLFNGVLLEWAAATANITVECVPDLPPLIR